MTLRHCKNILFLMIFMIATGVLVSLSYDTLSCSGYHEVSAQTEPRTNLIFVNAYAAEQAQQISSASIEAAEEFIQTMGDDVIRAISNGAASSREKKATLTEVLNRNFDMHTINRFTMGRYWRQMTPTQREEYAKLYEKFIVSVYAHKFSNYQGETIQVGYATPRDERDYIVRSHIIRPKDKDILVDWHVRYKNNQFKIIDVAIENVSMIITQKSDFASAIQRQGGDPAVILDFLRNQLKEQG